MTKDEFMEKFKDIPFRFSWYYKYCFYFIATDKEGQLLSVCVGGNDSDIYRFEVRTDKDYSLSYLEPFSANINGQQIFYDF